jgi:hypothetical protein
LPVTINRKPRSRKNGIAGHDAGNAGHDRRNTHPEVLDALQRIERKGNIETAHRVRALVGQVMRYAIATGRAQGDVAADLRGAIPPASTRHHAAVTVPQLVFVHTRWLGFDEAIFLTVEWSKVVVRNIDPL